jgi:YfiH family protein
VLKSVPADEPFPGTFSGQEREGAAGEFQLLLLEGWMDSYPGFVAGTTMRPTDFGLNAPDTPWTVSERFEALGRVLGFEAVSVARQVHGSKVITLAQRGLPGFHVCGDGDGLATDRAGLMMTVTVADCVPVFVIDPGSRAMALLHAGWRGAAEGVLAKGLAALTGMTGSPIAELLLHLGPAICGACYEVGPEVLSRFGLPADEPGPLDLRDRLTAQALQHGVPGPAISRSPRCTACDKVRLHSHRGSDGMAGRMVSFIGYRSGSS